MANMTEHEKLRQPWTLLQSADAVKKELEQHKDKLIILIFNLIDVTRESIEYPLKRLRNKYGDHPDANTLFFKCPVIQTSDALAAAFSIERVPTLIFYRNNEECARLEKPTEEALTNKFDELNKK